MPKTNFVLSKVPTDNVTIEYGYNTGDPENPTWTRTGGLKIVTLNEKIAGAGYGGGDTIHADGDVLFKPQNGASSIYWTITKTDTIDYPIVWDYARCQYAAKEPPSSSKNDIKVWDCSTEDSIEIVKFVRNFYMHLKQALPILMGYRYQKHVFGDYTNSLGKSLLDYDEENTFVIKTIPVMNDDGLLEQFKISYKGGNFQAGKQFSYSHCIVDLNPMISEYNASVPSDLQGKPEFML